MTRRRIPWAPATTLPGWACFWRWEEVSEQQFSLGDVMAFATGHDELQGRAEGINEEIGLCC